MFETLRNIHLTPKGFLHIEIDTMAIQSCILVCSASTSLWCAQKKGCTVQDLESVYSASLCGHPQLGTGSDKLSALAPVILNLQLRIYKFFKWMMKWQKQTFKKCGNSNCGAAKLYNICLKACNLHVKLQWPSDLTWEVKFPLYIIIFELLVINIQGWS